MNNYQLYKTNVLLGGLVCWDITLNTDEENLYVSDFHVTPINKSIPFNYILDKYELNSSHQYNITQLYKNIRGNFYNGYINPLLTHDYPIVVDSDDNYIKPHNDIYETGCQRTSVNTYGKQFEFLCPIWLELLSDDSVLSFNIIMKTFNDNEENIINVDTVSFKPLLNHNFHNKFIEYFKNYIKYIGVDKGNDNIIKIDFKNKNSFISGLQVTSGNEMTLDDEALTYNMTSRERPLMEFDSFIINTFKNNNLIANQLFNFRFHFNIEDLIPILLNKMSDWSNFIVLMEVKIDDNTIPLVDTFNNFDDILRKYCTNKYNNYLSEDEDMSKFNVLNYLNDNKCLDLINKNKMYQSIIHWSISDNNEYIFNLYDGFAGYSITQNDELINHRHLYQDTPNIYLPKYYESLNNIKWCNHMDLINTTSNISLVYRMLENVLKFLTLDDLYNYPMEICNELTDKFPTIDNPWLHNIKYNIKNPDTNDYTEGLSVLTLLLKAKNGSSIAEAWGLYDKYFSSNNNENEPNRLISMDLTENLKVLHKADKADPYKFLIFVSDNPDLLTYAGLKEALKIYLNNESPIKDIKYIYNTMSNVEKIPIITFDKSVLKKIAPSPSLNSLEINYYKQNNVKKYVFRYDGKIKPTFIIPGENEKYNLFFYKQIFTFNEIKTDEIYSKFIPLKYQPLYPSIGYYPIKSKKINYEQPTNENKDDLEYKWISDLEYKWFNKSKILDTPIIINTTVEINLLPGEYIKTLDFETELFEKIKKDYNFNDKYIKFIKDKYKYEVVDDYLKDNIHTYIVKLKLI